MMRLNLIYTCFTLLALSFVLDTTGENIFWTLRKPRQAIRSAAVTSSRDAADFGELKSILSLEIDLTGVDMSIENFIERVVEKDVTLRIKSRLFGWHSYEFFGDDGGDNSYNLLSVAKKKRCIVQLVFEEGSNSGTVKYVPHHLCPFFLNHSHLI